ncbi:DUF1810 domain-containing protein [Sphingomonas rubra]|uniref:Uncharacterized protein, DUF1810 family n=1 Tax=Sphingomonas rubra TaxID=634430 RepID=A0A1I5TW19_9SPHN|nr:DUF1810 domain-containing protein [Sphingomonas rubra]SFP87199.1 Uncharacterized protein, DUF1810 family [Sphingomonas rubra]
MDALHRFVDAQATSFEQALAELRAGTKRSHWMWWIFPQIAGLGRSETARHYAIASRAEAVAYLRHSLLGPRLIAAAEAVHGAPGSAVAIMGSVDAVKLRSSMTLFAAVAADPAPFRAVLDRFYDGIDDPETLARIRVRDPG